MDVRYICDKIWPIVCEHKGGKHVEIEMRLGKFNGKMFDTNVGKTSFDKILFGLQKYSEWEKIVNTSSEVFYRNDGFRKSVDETTGEETIVQKERVWNEDFNKIDGAPYDVRFSVSKEYPLPPNTNREMDKKKTKNRMSFVRKNISIDMTVCTGDSYDKDAEELTTYQIELEIIDPMCIHTKNEMFNIVHKIKDLFNLLDTNI